MAGSPSDELQSPVFRFSVAGGRYCRLMSVDVSAARSFIHTRARIIEQRRAEFHLDGSTSAGTAVVRGLEAYRNEDYGFGHGIEPDLLAPVSQPLGVDAAFDILYELALSAPSGPVAQLAADAAQATLPYLAQTAADDGGLPIVFASAANSPRADHWGDCEFPPLLNPTAKIVGNARALGVNHVWLDQASQFCRAAITAGDAVTDAHTALCVLRFLETEPDREWATTAHDELGRRLCDLDLFQTMPGEGYGLTPLTFAPQPNSPRRRFFSETAITAHLEVLMSTQMADGGWAIAWQPPGPAAESAWRGVWTLSALRVLRAYEQL